MMSLEEEGQLLEEEKWKADEDEGYSIVYTKTHEKRAEQSMSRAERREQDEKHKKDEAAKKAAQEEADRLAQEEAKCVIKRAQLKEEQLAIQKRLEHKRKLQEMVEKGGMQEPNKDPDRSFWDISLLLLPVCHLVPQVYQA